MNQLILLRYEHGMLVVDAVANDNSGALISRLTGLADPLDVPNLDKWLLCRVVRVVDLANHTFAQLRIGHRVW